ncbi:hypothetical protein HPB47_027170 [Ixodes persulcatus]|uniref:Uncharacterized protein n=1 Tax=Ixodes persulcatus TaxID=34615 RepID=A0AC60PYM9_IXOPE|nr:hypothetical protein HPB47_027170 [Ixodes persulcatus]
MALEDRIKPPLEPRPNLATTAVAAAAAAAAMPKPPANDQSPAVTEPNPNDGTTEFDELIGRTLSHPGPWRQMLSDRRAFNQRVVIQVQTVPYDTYADALSNVTSLELDDATYKISPYVKPFPGTVRGVTHGLDPGTTTEQLPNIIASPGPKIQQARMLGKSISAVVTFEGQHVPFYIHAHGLYTRCRPYRHYIQCCTLCGDIAHRRDICPHPKVTVCERCHERNPAKDSRKKLRPPPMPLHVRERRPRTTPTLQRQPLHQVPAAHPPPPPQAQVNTQRRHSPSQQGSWPAIKRPRMISPHRPHS